jgi:uncharacterized C2H2 Zn-finger protein
MKNNAFLAVTLTALLINLTCMARSAELDFKDYDDDLMRTLDKTIKYFEPDITAKNIEGATEDGEILLDGFKYTEDYFSKVNKADAVQISREGSALVSLALELVAKNDFEEAAANAREAITKCKACHDIYRPRLSR